MNPGTCEEDNFVAHDRFEPSRDTAHRKGIVSEMDAQPFRRHDPVGATDDRVANPARSLRDPLRGRRINPRM
ncbi:protein of unknown function [Paraburkholderia kururiensis]